MEELVTLAYDIGCIVTSLAYTFAGLACLISGKEQWRFIWFVVMASGLASCNMRVQRMYAKTCSLKFGLFCTRMGMLRWIVDVSLALILFFSLYTDPESISSVPLNLATTLSLLSWSVWWVKSSDRQYGFNPVSCTLHFGAHVIGAMGLWHTAYRLWHQHAPLG